MRKTLISLLFLLAFSLPGKAQFFLTGEDPGHLRWYSVESAHYQVIFPSGADSLARVYARLLEQFRVPMGKSIGELPGTGKKFPVVLHTHYPYSNGSVAYAPRRMDLYTMPEAYGSDPSPWAVQLAAHEPRHQAQMQLSAKGFMRSFPYIIGEAWNPVGWYLYFDSSLGEGDAVAAETGLTGGTRARTADFLEYIRVALDQGDYRSYDRWYFGSYKKYTPDLYKASYMAVAGGRYLLDNPMFTADVAGHSLHHPLPFSPGSFKKATRDSLGKKKYDGAFALIMDAFNDAWQESARERAPFVELEQVTSKESFPVDYCNPVYGGNRLFAVRSGYLYPAQLVELEGGRALHIHFIGAHSSNLVYDSKRNRIWWSETRRDPRWSLSGSSVVCYYDILERRTHTLVAGTRYYSPQLSEDGTRLYVVEYRTDGSQAVLALNPENGKTLEERKGLSGVQFTQTACLGEDFYATGVGQGGYGLWKLSGGGDWEEVLAPSAQKISNFGSEDGVLEWVSDRTGVNELYRYAPEDGKLLQMTSTRYGAGDFCRVGEKLYCTSQTLDGKMLFKVEEDALEPREVVFSDLAAHPIEDKLTAQEEALGPQPDLSSEVEISAPRRYSKVGHTSLHSWLPFYADADAVMSGSFDFVYENASLGLSGFFQNTLSTLSGQVGWGIHPDPDQNGVWRNALHLRATCSGWLPVVEFRLDLGDRLATQYFVEKHFNADGSGTMAAYTALRKEPLLTTSLNVYIPLQFQRNGMLYGITPQVRYTLSNNVFARGAMEFVQSPGFGRKLYQAYSSASPDPLYMQRLSAAVRAYWMQPRATKAIYPRWGVGLEAGYNSRPGIREYFAPNVYAYIYGYTPGFARTQGLRLTGTVQQRLSPEKPRFGELAANTLPRGFESAVQSLAGQLFPFQWKVTADYAIPIYFGDICLPGLLYIQKFLASPHFDFSGLGGAENLWSAGVDLTANFRQIILLTKPTTLGVSVNYMGGSWYAASGQEDPWSVNLILSIDF